MLHIQPDAANPKTFRRIAEAPAGSRQVIRHWFFFHGEDLVAEVERSGAKGPHTGTKRPKWVRRRYPRSTKRASRSGRAHANLSKRLTKSRGWKVVGTKRMDFGWGVAPDKKNPMPKHGVYLEEGATGAGKSRNVTIGPRPTLKLAIRAMQGRAGKNYERALRKEKFT